MSKHTPGPWKVSGPSCPGKPVCYCGDDSFHEANIVGGPVAGGFDPIAQTPAGGDRERRKANARLIAAAPEMLDALQGAWPMLDACAEQLADDESCEESGRRAEKAAECAEKLRVAIAKATQQEAA